MRSNVALSSVLSCLAILVVLGGCQKLVSYAQGGDPEYGDEEDTIELREDLIVQQSEEGVVLVVGDSQIELSSEKAYQLGLVLRRAAYDITLVGPDRPIGPVGPRCMPAAETGFLELSGRRFFPCPPPPLQPEEQREIMGAEFAEDIPPIEELTRVPGGALEGTRR